MIVERFIYALHDTVDDKYWTGGYPNWDEFRLGKLWHREGDAKRMLKRAIKDFDWFLESALVRLADHPNNSDVMDAARSARDRNLHPNHGIKIVKLLVTPV